MDWGLEQLQWGGGAGAQYSQRSQESQWVSGLVSAHAVRQLQLTSWHVEVKALSSQEIMR